MRLGLILLLAPLTLSAPAAAAPPGAAPESPPIVIEGVHDRANRVSKFVKDLTPSTMSYNQLSRWEVPVCPAAFGLPMPQRTFVVDRMRNIAKTAGVALAKPGCDPNMIVIVTSNKAALLTALETRRPNYFPTEWGTRQIHGVENDPSPVAAWQFEGLLSADGLRVAETTDPSSLDPVDPAGLVAATIPTTAPASRLRPPGRRDVLTSILIVQSNALSGVTTTQFADYAAMRSLVRTDPKGGTRVLDRYDPEGARRTDGCGGAALAYEPRPGVPEGFLREQKRELRGGPKK